MSKPYLHVAAALIENTQQQFLLASRPHDKSWGGWWELPGGKIEANETPLEAVIRELEEELGIQVTAVTPWVVYEHEYPNTRVQLNFCRVTAWQGTPRGIEGQELGWFSAEEALKGPLQLLPAAFPPLRWSQLPTRYVLTDLRNPDHVDDWLAQLTQAHSRGSDMMVQFREAEWQQRAEQSPREAETLAAAWQACLTTCRQLGIPCVVNSRHPQAWWAEADGVQLRAIDAAQYAAQVAEPLKSDVAHADPVLPIPSHVKVGVSVHNEAELAAAQRLNAQFVVIGHVLPTPSHPNQTPLEWSGFQALAQAAQRPAYAIGGQNSDSLATAFASGAHGVAGRSQLLESL